MTLPTKFFANFITAVTLVVIVCSTLIGWHKFINQLGGLKSFGGLVALLVMALVIVGGIYYLQTMNYVSRRGRQVVDLVVAAMIVILLGIIGLNWIDLPSGAGMKVVLCIAFCAVAAMITTFVGEVETT